MRVTVKIKKEIELKNLIISANVRYWDDAELNGEKLNEDGGGFPCKKGDLWEPIIHIESGKIMNWLEGNTANIHFKVCDQCSYSISDEEDNIVLEHTEMYVPNIICPEDDGYGDYIIMLVEKDGCISKWKKELITNLFDTED